MLKNLFRRENAGDRERGGSEKPMFKKWEIALAIGLLAALLFGRALTSFAGSGLTDNLIRLHVQAASNSAYDQELKLAVRDEVLDMLKPMLAGVEDVSSAEKIVIGELENIEENLQHFLVEQGSSQGVTAEYGRGAFPTREYATFALPAGFYKALRIKLDDGTGENWWCVVFPPLCAQAAIEFHPENPVAGLDETDIKIITKADEEHQIRFRILEWLGEFRERFRR